MSLLEEALLLQRAAHDLMYLGMDGSPIYSDDLSRRNSEVYRLTTTLYNSGTWGTTVEEQANVCLALLKGYSASFIDHGEKQQHVQEVLRRCWDILGYSSFLFIETSFAYGLLWRGVSMSLWPTRAVLSLLLGVLHH